MRMTYRATAVLSLLVGLAGCSGDPISRQVAQMNASNIQRVSNIYAAFQNYRNGRGPKDEPEFKTFMKEFDPAKLKMMGIDPNNVDAVFLSERDSKPFKVRYQVGGGRGSVDAVAFEQEGRNGKKQVGFTGGKVEEVDEVAYQQLLAGKRAAQPAGAPPAEAGRPSGPPPGAPTGPKG